MEIGDMFHTNTDYEAVANGFSKYSEPHTYYKVIDKNSKGFMVEYYDSDGCVVATEFIGNEDMEYRLKTSYYTLVDKLPFY